MDRPEIALANLMRGEPGASMRALFAPKTLSPLESRDFLDMMGISSDERKDPWGTVLGIITNPLVILGTIAAMRYPVAKLADMNKFSEAVLKSAKRFGFMAKFKHVDSIYRDQPDLVDAWHLAFGTTHEFKKKYLTGASQIVDDFQREAGRQFGAQDQFIAATVMRNLHNKVVGYKMATPINKAALMKDYDKPLQKLTDRFRSLYDDVWGELTGTPEKRKALGTAIEMREAKTAARLAKLPKDLRPGAKRHHITFGDYKEQYLPNLLDTSQISLDMEARWLAEKVGVSKAELMRRTEAGLANYTSTSLLKRKNILLPNADGLAKFPKYIDETKLAKLRAVERELPRSPIMVGEETLSVRPVYKMGFLDTFERYVNGMAGTAGWTLSGAGKRIEMGITALKKSGDAGRAELMANTYVPLGKGLMTPRQAMAAQQWGHTMTWARETLTSDKLPLPKAIKNWLEKGLSADRGPYGFSQMSTGAAGWLYLSTLGGNPGSAMLNLMQTFLTTAPLLGPRATGHGMSRVYDKSKKYFGLRKSGKNHETAMAKAFPDFEEAGLSAHPITDEATRNTFRYAWDESKLKLPGRYKEGWDRTKSALMWLFSRTEQFNRVVAFESAMWKGANEGMKRGPLMKAARDVVAKTQFLTGPETTPAILVDKNPLIRQYLMFPTKMAQFVLDTAQATGSGVQAGFLGRNWGTLGRAMAYSGGLYEAGKSLGMDLSGGLVTGSLPVPRTDSPFGVFPLVPPAFQLGGSALQSLLTGDIEPLQKTLPLLVPGGVPAARAAGLVPGLAGPEVGKALGRYYADYEQRTPDGRIAVFSRDGNLVGYETTMQLITRGLGLPGAGGELRNEARAIPWILKNRDRIREARRDYLEAMFQSDYNRMTGIREDFERAYGIPLMLKQSHIEAMQMRRMVPRLERILNTLPPEMRPQFAQLIQTSILGRGSQFLGIDPQLLQSGSPQQRMSQRYARPKLPSGYHRSGAYSQQMGPFDSINAQQIGRNVLPEPTASSPTMGLSLGGF
ncbi:MAG: hypothetical protein V3S37_03100 [Dehalococcoidia bacterium]